MGEIIFKKLVNAGKSESFHANFEIEIRKNNSNLPVLSISGNIRGPHKYICCGQCIDEIVRLFPTKKNQRIKQIWERWHLNDLHAGCEHQRGYEKEPYEKHADCVCNVCNYKYGTSWIYEKLPDEIISEIKLL